jgi:hypothetical protein
MSGRPWRTAVAALKRAAQLRPNEGFEKFMYLGQLLDDGVAAATCTRQGLALIEWQASQGDEDAEERMCGACCALVEQLMGRGLHSFPFPHNVSSLCPFRSIKVTLSPM